MARHGGIAVTPFVVALVSGCSAGGEIPAAAVQPTGVPAATVDRAPVPSSGTAAARIPLDHDAGDGPDVACSGELTAANQEGPFYRPGSPERSTLIEPAMPGVPVLITGRVFDQDCQPLAGARLDFWLADVDGTYDNAGYRLRGHLFADELGHYALETIEPTAYTGRPPHIHVKVFAPDGREILTTQLYFGGSEGSADVAAEPGLLVAYGEPDAEGRRSVQFNFVVKD